MPVPWIDRQTVKPALLVVALALLMSVVLPLIDSETPYRDALQRGDIVELADRLTLVPCAGERIRYPPLPGDDRAGCRWNRRGFRRRK